MELSYFQAVFTGLIQGVTELFPVSSLGHAVLVPAWLGGSWAKFTTNPESGYLTITIALHLASALALFLVFRKRWFSLIGAGLSSLRSRHTVTSTVFWRLVVATIPVGILGFTFEEPLQELFSKPMASAIFITINGVILFLVERLTNRSPGSQSPQEENVDIASRISIFGAVAIGFGQSLALFAGISRFGISMSAGLIRGLKHSTASDFAFLLALPVILGAAILKVPELFTPENSHLAGPIIAGSIVSFFATYGAVTFLVRWFKSKTLYPFAIYCVIIGIASIVRFI